MKVIIERIEGTNQWKVELGAVSTVCNNFEDALLEAESLVNNELDIEEDEECGSRLAEREYQEVIRTNCRNLH